MGIVHSALRRDLERTRLVLVSESPPDERRRRELADHIVWMMRALHLHHTAEDAGLWPLIRARNPSASALLDEMANDHRRIAPAITALEEAHNSRREIRYSVILSDSSCCLAACLGKSGIGTHRRAGHRIGTHPDPVGTRTEPNLSVPDDTVDAAVEHDEMFPAGTDRRRHGAGVNG
ncbi:hemerythrin domain-containing protein [Rhodococcus zopfii]